MTILAGIDEAGYGPLLGPLVVSGVVFSIPKSLLKADLWQVLQKAVSKEKTSLAGRLLITDSKKAYTRVSGIGHLQKTVLAALEACLLSGAIPAPASFKTAGQIIRHLCCDCRESLKEYPWYQDIDGHPVESAGDVSIAAGVFNRTLAENQMRLVWMQSRFLEAAHYNQRIEKIKNKSRVLFIELCSLIQHIYTNFHDNDGPMQFLIDRQGGRTQYHSELIRMFPQMELTILSESDTLSSYELTEANRSMRLHFTTQADSKFLAVSLASMVSKYIRELLMDNLNAYFLKSYPSLKSTAGYWQDGQRFIKDLSNIDPDYIILKDKLIRVK